MEEKRGFSLLADEKQLVEIWKTLTQMQRHQVEFILNNAKFIFTIITALLAVYITVFSVKVDILEPFWREIYLILISVFLLTLSVFGWFSAGRDYDRFLEIIAYRAKIEYLMGLFKECKLPIFPKEKYIFDRWAKASLEKGYATAEEFVKGERNRRGNLLYSMKIIYGIFCVISTLMFLVGFYLLLT
jgi:hypothetical protein